jgi:hypothetical protein
LILRRFWENSELSKPNLLVVDSSVALHLLLARPHSGQEEGWKAAQELRRVDDAVWTLALAAPALGEVLTGVPKPKRSKALTALQKMFQMLALDVECAMYVADLASKGVRGRNPAVSRQRVKVDVEIVACALRWGAKGLCVLDGDHHGILTRNRITTMLCGAPITFTPPQQSFVPG